MAFVGELRVPGDKSIAHRALMMAAMREGETLVGGLPDGADVRSTIRVLEQLGARVSHGDEASGWPTDEPGDLPARPACGVRIVGWGSAGPQQPDAPLDCGNSATTARLAMGLIAPWNISAVITGDESLRSRPMARVIEPLSQMGASFSHDRLPLEMRGTSCLKGIDCELPVSSAQVKSAILLAGMHARGRTRVREPFPSRNHTELMMRCEGEVLRSRSYFVPGDPSSAAFVALAAIVEPGSDVLMPDLCLNPTRIAFAEQLQRMGADIAWCVSAERCGEPVGMMRARYSPALHAVDVPDESVPSLIDELPVLAFAAALAEGETVFCGVQELRVKESDRLRAIVAGLRAAGVRAWTEEGRGAGEDLHVAGCPGLRGPAGLAFPEDARLESGGDHRMALLWQLADICNAYPLRVSGSGAGAVSYPGFADDLRGLCVQGRPVQKGSQR